MEEGIGEKGCIIDGYESDAKFGHERERERERERRPGR